MRDVAVLFLHLLRPSPDSSGLAARVLWSPNPCSSRTNC